MVVSAPEERPRRRGAPPERGWALGAGGLPRAFWGSLAFLLAALAVLLLALDYYGYGSLVLILSAAASVNLW
jgi:hypothetical protein